MNTDFAVVFYEPLPHSAVDPATQYHVFMWAPIGIGTHSSIVSRTMTMCIYVLSPNLVLIADARHYYPLIINASQAIRVPTSLIMMICCCDMMSIWYKNACENDL